MSRIPMGQECMNYDCKELAKIKVGEMYYCNKCNSFNKSFINIPRIEVYPGQQITNTLENTLRPTEIAVIFTEETLQSIISDKIREEKFIMWLVKGVYPALLKTKRGINGTKINSSGTR